MPADLIIYAFIAVGLVFWLRNTLGTHEEGDEPVNVRSPLPALDEDLPSALKADVMDAPKTPEEQIADVMKNNKSGVIAIESEQAEQGVAAIMGADKSFDLKFFFSAVQDVFVMVVEAFAEGDRDDLEQMLGEDVYAAFDQAISDREDAGLRAKSEVQSIREVHIIEADLQGKQAFVTVRFVVDQISVTYDSDDKVVEGHPERAAHMKDIWVFSRNLKSKDPRWLVVETRGDFEGDNDIIPNA